MEDDTGKKKAPPGEVQLEHMTHLSLEIAKSSEPNSKVKENDLAKSEVDIATDESTSPMNLEEPPADNASSCSDCKARLESGPTMGLSTDPTNLGEALAEDAGAWSDLNDGLETDPTKCETSNSENTTEDPEENGNAPSGIKTEPRTVPDVKLDESPKEYQANIEGEYLGPPGQDREGLQRAMEEFMALETEEDSDQSTKSQAHGLYEEDSHLQLPDWQDDDLDSMDSDLDATMDQNIADQPNEVATAHDWQKEEYITREEWSDKPFLLAEERFKRLKNPTAEDEILFAKAKRDEEQRRKVLHSRFANGEASLPEHEESLFVEEADLPGSSSSAGQQTQATGSKMAAQKQVPKKRRISKPSQKEKTKSMELGLRRMVGTNQYTGKLYGITPTVDEKKGKTGKRMSRKKTTRLSDKELESLWNPGELIASAQKNAALREIPTFTSGDKSKALTELIASIPALSPDDQAAAKSDRLRILEATRKFDHKPSSDGKGLWKVKGLNTSLLHHQVLAVGWMRERERSTTHPLGGLLCDVMGFGKTVTSLTNILDGRSANIDEQRPPTLIVAPTGLLTHWAHQINKYCDTEAFGFVEVYQGYRRMSIQNDIKGIHRCDVMLCSYEDVRKSYPAPKPPINLESDEEIETWWVKFYDEELGILHRIKWHRIVLDGNVFVIFGVGGRMAEACTEGHVIKNPDSATSIAIRALTATHKWVLSGTPLHNCIEELYPYFNFIGVPNCATLDRFEQTFCDETANSRKRLINVLRSILHRKTHDSRLFSLPLIKLPKITQREVIVELCEAESILYDRIVQNYIVNVNDLSRPGCMASQWQCILTMFLKLRMFTSHPLTAQDAVQKGLDDETVNELRTLDGLYDININPSGQIIRMLLLAKFECSIPTTPAVPAEDEITHTPPTGNRTKLIREFRDFMEMLHEEERWQDRLERLECPLCCHIPVKAIITSCKHMYCEECFHQLPDEEGRLGTESKLCRGCMGPITEAAQCGVFDKVDPGGYESSSSSANSPSPAKRKRQERAKKAKASKKLRKGSKRQHIAAMFNKYRVQTDDSDDENDSDHDFVAEDWIPVIGEKTPGAKLTKVKDIVMEWMKKDNSVKIVLFTQFLDTIRLLKSMCGQQGWLYTTISGKMTPISRDQNIARFREDSDIKIMISSLKTGGVGLDLSVANKCILMDLWWNEAVQEQAYCRLFRIGQKREVEFVKVVAKGTIDDKMLELQKDKTERIQKVLSLNVLESRDTVKDILGFFGKVTTVKGGGFWVELDSGKGAT